MKLIVFPEGSMHHKLILGIFNKVGTPLPYMGMTNMHRIKCIFDLDLSYVVFHQSLMYFKVIS